VTVVTSCLCTTNVTHFDSEVRWKRHWCSDIEQTVISLTHNACRRLRQQKWYIIDISGLWMCDRRRTSTHQLWRLLSCPTTLMLNQTLMTIIFLIRTNQSFTRKWDQT